MEALQFPSNAKAAPRWPTSVYSPNTHTGTFRGCQPTANTLGGNDTINVVTRGMSKTHTGAHSPPKVRRESQEQEHPGWTELSPVFHFSRVDRQAGERGKTGEERREERREVAALVCVRPSRGGRLSRRGEMKRREEEGSEVERKHVY